jgi:hypothetical protein
MDEQNTETPKLRFVTPEAPQGADTLNSLSDADKAKIQETIKQQQEEQKRHEEYMGKLQYMAAMQIIIALNGSTAETDKFLKAEDMDALVRKYGMRSASLKAGILTFLNATMLSTPQMPKMPQAPKTITVQKDQVPQ